MFDLVDEVLLEILKQKFREKKLCFSQRFCDRLTITELTERVWNRVGEFPCAKCEVLDDIDNLIESEDMKKLINVEHEEEKEDLVMEIEGNILDTLMYELFWL
jgi:nicotinic acid phosphoribosyltransferase